MQKVRLFIGIPRKPEPQESHSGTTFLLTTVIWNMNLAAVRIFYSGLDQFEYDNMHSITEIVYTTKRLEADLNLQPCSKYKIGVRAIEKAGSKVQPDTWLRIKTHYDHEIPPKNAKMDVIRKELRFSWEHNCNISGERQAYYVFKIHDISLNKTNEVRVDGLWYRFEKYGLGAEYNFSVSASAPDAIAATWHFKAPSLPIPTNLRIARIEGNRYTFEWEPITNINEK